MSPKVSLDMLPSGLPIVTIETPHLHSAVVAVHVRVGSRHETEATNGVSHLLEHLFFRGSARYPDSVAMNAAVEAVGGNLNAVTMRDSSSYYTPTHPKGVDVALRILGDMLTRPRLRALETEKRIILEEMLDEVDEDGRDIDIDNLTKFALYGRHPLAMKIAGTPKSVKGLTLAMARKHFEQFYVASNMVVSVAGPLARRSVVAMCKEAFKKVPPGPRAVEEAPPTVPIRKMHFVRLDEAQVAFRLCFPTVHEVHPDAMPLQLLRRVLDDGLSSRLPYRVVEKRGLAYSIQATTEGIHDAGTFDIDAACAPEHLGPVVAETLRTLKTLKAGAIENDELLRTQRRHRMHLEFLRDSPGDLAAWFGGMALYRPLATLESRAREAERVTLADLRRVAQQYLRAETMVTLAVGPRRAKSKLDAAIRRAGQLLG